MSAINLQNGLEALYYFDEKNFDSQRNQIRDHSGYARHAEASGGPTIGVEGPDDFKATSFDGNDDEFDTRYANEFTLNTDFSLFGQLLIRSESGAQRSSIITAGTTTNSVGLDAEEGGEVRFGIRDTDDTVVTVEVSEDSNEWINAVGVYHSDDNELFIYTNEQSDRTVGSFSGSLSTNVTWQTGNRNIVSGDPIYFDGKISNYGIWSRALSKAEIEHLNRLTAPRRAML